MQDLRRLPNGVHGGVFGGGAAAVFAGGMMAGAAASGVAVAAADRRLRPPPQQNLKCPRCDSINTKFCYYNNYNISQPRHFCKSCRRYWTKGGVLRNVPVGGSCRKSKRSSSSSSSSSSSRSPNLREEPKKTGQSPSPAAVPDPGRACPVSVSYAAALMETTAEAAAPPPPVAAPLFPQMRSIKVSDFHDDVAAAANARNLHFQRPRFAPAADGNVKLPAAATPAGIMDPIMLMHPPPANPPTLPPPQLPALDWHVTMETPSWLFEDQGGLWNHNHWGEIDPSLFLP